MKAGVEHCQHAVPQNPRDGGVKDAGREAKLHSRSFQRQVYRVGAAGDCSGAGRNGGSGDRHRLDSKLPKPGAKTLAGYEGRVDPAEVRLLWI